MQKHWANTLKSFVPNGYRELNLSSKGKTPRPWPKLAPAPDTHTLARYTLKKTQKSKTRFTNFIINFDRNQITKYLKSQQTHTHTHMHTQMDRQIRALSETIVSTVFFISFNDFLVVPIQTTPNKSSSDSMALETSTRTNFFYSDKFTWQWVATKPGQPVEVIARHRGGQTDSGTEGQSDSGTEAASKPGPKHGRWPQQPHP